MTAKRLAFISQKGGVGKTTIGVNLSASLGQLNKKVLLVDLGPVGGATAYMDAEEHGDALYELMVGDCSIEDVIKPTQWDNISIIGCCNRGAVEKSLGMKYLATRLLDKKMKELKGFDYIIFDCSNNMGILDTSALFAAKNVIVPLEFRYLSMRGVDRIYAMIDDLRNTLTTELNFLGFVGNRYNESSVECNMVVNMFQSITQELRFKTIIPESEQICISSEHHKPEIYYSEKDKKAQAYMSLARELEGIA